MGSHVDIEGLQMLAGGSQVARKWIAAARRWLANGSQLLASQGSNATPKWTRDMAMVACKFRKTVATYSLSDGLKVNFQQSDTELEIQIAREWQNIDDSGYIGEGFSKRGIYARYGNKEDVLTQPVDASMSSDAVKDVLHAEYALLCVGNTLKQEFNSYAANAGVANIPDFYFNYRESFVGALVPSTSSASRHLTHRTFIATLLLPCGDLDSKIRKFTGNDEFGDIGAGDHLATAVHAFTHFTAVYTQQTIVFCDLQGLYDNKQVMCLIDPQAHTACRGENNSCYEYWDRGPKKMAEFMSVQVYIYSLPTLYTFLGIVHHQVALSTNFQALSTNFQALSTNFQALSTIHYGYLPK
ncbi:hypothetical protein D9613_012819 [Agrocybe pediades]|uniref:Alpha-type protein kinase domain-containing protein n=1 Tax=Agrocybe pediades TaxID=84607 RepID=A0A8H4R3F0_9AGAR|nr:hypothetical protein D9613_012819 [Agrocybe pediades]